MKSLIWSLLLVPLACGYTVRPLPQLAGRAATASSARIYACAANDSAADEVDADFAKRLAYEEALKAAILEQGKPKPPNRVAGVAGFFVLLLAMGSAISFAFSPAADQFTGRG